MRRRTLLAAVGAGTLSFAGCLSEAAPEAADDGPADGSDSPADGSDLPADCPTSQGLDVDWPSDLDAETVESFVEDYEHVYYRDVVVEYEPSSPLDSYELGGHVTEGPRQAGDGWVLTYDGSGGVYRPTLHFAATVGSPPEGTEPVGIEEIELSALSQTLEEAAETGDAEFHLDQPGEDVERYLSSLDSLSAEFDGLSGRGDSDSLYVDVDGTAVELTVSASSFHGDYWWEARYYVDERVVRRTDDPDADPQNGTLLECRTSG